ncbi:MAG: hypothetical protein GY953_56530, partial [bacterium]|nr:hypothetical protein [bacterium]
MLNRRQFLTATAGLAVANAAAPTRNIRWSLSGFIWQKEIEQGVKDTARFGFHGIEPFRSHILPYLD